MQKQQIQSVCPTYVGMNRIVDGQEPERPGMPHVCGDEPTRKDKVNLALRMPHVCGDEPFSAVVSGRICRYAPRMWG